MTTMDVDSEFARKKQKSYFTVILSKIILHGLERGTKYHVTQAQDNITYIFLRKRKSNYVPNV